MFKRLDVYGKNKEKSQYVFSYIVDKFQIHLNKSGNKLVWCELMVIRSLISRDSICMAMRLFICNYHNVRT